MTSKHEITEALIAAGEARIEPIEPRIDALEARLMSAITADDRPALGVVLAGGATDVVARQRTRRARLTLMAAAASIIAVLVLAFTVPGGRNDGLIIAAADGVSIVLPDGSEIVGEVGVELSEGARLDVGRSVRVGDLQYGPGTYVVSSDRLVPVTGVTDTASRGPISTAPSTTAGATVDAEPDRPRVESTIVDTRTSTVSGDADTGPSTTERIRQTDTRPPPTGLATTVPVTRPATTVAITRPATTTPTTTSATTPTTTPTTTSATTPTTRPPTTDAPAFRPAQTRPTTTTPVTRPPATDAPVRRPITTSDG